MHWTNSSVPGNPSSNPASLSSVPGSPTFISITSSSFVQVSPTASRSQPSGNDYSHSMNPISSYPISTSSHPEGPGSSQTARPQVSNSHGNYSYGFTTSTVYTTTTVTITKCPAYVTDCPAESTEIRTSTIPVSTTICPLEGNELPTHTKGGWLSSAAFEVKPTAAWLPESSAFNGLVGGFSFPSCIPTTTKVYVTVTVTPEPTGTDLWKRGPIQAPQYGFPDYTYSTSCATTTTTSYTSTSTKTSQVPPWGTTTVTSLYATTTTVTPSTPAWGVLTLTASPSGTAYHYDYILGDAHFRYTYADSHPVRLQHDFHEYLVEPVYSYHDFECCFDLHNHCHTHLGYCDNDNYEGYDYNHNNSLRHNAEYDNYVYFDCNQLSRSKLAITCPD
ncbi:uncharacterized protein PV09_02048 [Verruconis gallopava]|uniref:Ig-like domain-containing protein n=1 Tax=Verruconis gallopava TaxID=253628 RepID=A0A0D1XWL7_9PEZI|nr:uncharacterized protein PV09_02048 [Verruconis gallopava]KIW07181.1 hypothetical protein PV09_02048 [Verruconis gallopava]